MFKLLLIFGVFYVGVESLIVPQEVPTILSLIYSNIPTIKKGTDSRLGWGFRLGNRADFQVLVELGPQTNTQPLANQPANPTSSKRNAINNLRDELWAQRQKEKQLKKEPEEVFSKTDGGNWLKEWSKGMKPQKPKIEENQVFTSEENPVLGIGEIDAKSVIPEDNEDNKKT